MMTTDRAALAEYTSIISEQLPGVVTERSRR